MTDLQVVLSLILVALLVLDLLNQAASTSLLGINLAKLLSLREETTEQINQALNLLKSLSRPRLSLRIMQNLLRLSLAAVVLLLVQSALPAGPADAGSADAGSAYAGWLIFASLLPTGLILAWLEWGVTQSVNNNPESWLTRLVAYIQTIRIIMTPLVFFPIAIFGEAKGELENTSRITEVELKSLVDAGEEEGVLEQEERKMIYSIIELGETLAREIMVPRIDVLALDVNTSLTESIDALLNSGYSRVPVYEETIDNIQGVLYAKDLLNTWRSGEQVQSLSALLRPAYFVPEAKKVDELLAEMQARRVHMALVVDEYGGIAGLVTLEDIVEEIVGEIRDEFDVLEEAFFQQVGPHEYVCSGRMPLDEFNELMEAHLPDDDADTLGGYIYSRIGRVPSDGESIRDGDLELVVEQVSKRRIRKVRARRIPPEQLEAEAEESHA